MRQFFCLAVALLLCVGSSVFAADDAAARKKAQETMTKGNYKDAFELFKKLALDPNTDPKLVGSDLQQGAQCLQNLGRLDESDAFRESVVEVHKANWRLLFAAAQNLTYDQHYGYIIAGKFSRGHHRGGGQYVNSIERDRIRGLQLAVQALEVSKGENDKKALADLYYQFASLLLNGGNGRDTWRLQYLSNLSELPDYEEQNRYYRGWGGNTKGAPVNDDGTPVFYSVGKDFKNAKNDGERWRWALSMVSELDPERTPQMRLEYANFLQTELDVRTLQSFPGLFNRSEEDKDAQNSIFAIKTLEEDETIARLASGVKRFKLPDEHNFIKIFRAVADESKGSGHARQAFEELAQTFEDRQQYTKAAAIWRRNIAECGNHDQKQQRLQQIVGNWGQFESTGALPAGAEATIEYRFRNATKVSFTANEINIPKLLDDVRIYLRSKPARIDWEQSNIENLGYRLVEKNQQQYIGAEAGKWEMELKPREGHYDRRVTVTTPLKKAGAYFVTAQVEGGNTSRMIFWINDAAIVSKNTNEGALYYVADAVTGAPLPGAKVDFFGYRQQWNNNQPFTELDESNAVTDANGQVLVKRDDKRNGFSWLTTAKAADGRMAHLGFRNIWLGRYNEMNYQQRKAFFITDRPVYRPNQPVKFKAWLGETRYGIDGGNATAGQSFHVEIRNPRGEKIYEKDHVADEFGGFDGELTLDKEAPLGQYAINVQNWWPGSSFRLEEYKKPEFEVKVDAPDEPVMLGEKIAAKLTAKYYFGAPVVDAKVKYKVTRTAHKANWYPSGRWDWFYNTGYWWFGNDYDWYPGFKAWGHRRPIPWWYGGRNEQPELVLENEVPVGKDGTVSVEIDTALAKAIHGDTDHRYEVSFDVTDQSRRTISGTGSVLVARQPFRVYTWVDRGHYRVGDTVGADFSAQTLDNKPVKGKGTAKLLKLSYDAAGKPTETLVQEWPVELAENGKAELQMKAAGAGQFRVSCSITDSKNRTIEGGYVFAVLGEKSEAKDFRFNAVEVTPDKREYKPGEKVKLLVNSNQTEGTVLLFARPSNGVYLAPKVLRLNGKSLVEEIEIAQKDMPNFFVEVLTVHGGKVHSDVREIVVPPESRVLNVDVATPKKELKPGEKAKVQIKVTDGSGEPYTGSLAVTVYDKSVEYISGGSNVPEIKSHFWKWRRNHHANNADSLTVYSGHIGKSREAQMQSLGAFGHLVAQMGSDKDRGAITGGELGEGGFGGGGGKGQGALKAAAAPGAPMAALAEADGTNANGRRAMDAVERQSEKRKNAAEDPGKPGDAPDVEPTVRKNFADTAFWTAKLTAANGLAEIEVPMPESLTTWKVKVWSMGAGMRVGQGETELITKKNLIVRLQAPRFFTQKDEVVLSANVHNYLASGKNVKIQIEADGSVLEMPAETKRSVEVGANGEQRIDWRVKVLAAGDPSIRVRAITDEESDAMEMKFPAYIHGMQKMESIAGNIRPDKESASFAFNVPAQRRAMDSKLEIRYSPTLAGAMVDALPYLVEYPHGCTEQTLSRFLPTVVTQRVLMRMNLNLKEVQQKITNLNAQEIGDDKERAKGWKRFNRNPVFDEQEVALMAKAGVDRLLNMQCNDGGWGWFSGAGEYSSPHTTAYTVHGLLAAKRNDIGVNDEALNKGVQWLKRFEAQQLQLIKNFEEKKENIHRKEFADNMDAFVYYVMAENKQQNKEMMERLYRDRNHLSVYGKSMLGLAMKMQNEKEKLDMLMQNIEQFLVQDEENQTAYLRFPENHAWWHWYGSEFEAHAYYLKLLAAADPKSEKASRLVKYLINNRKHASYWNSTRDTAICIEALAEYLTASGEDAPDMQLEVLVNGKAAKTVSISASNLFTFDNKVVLTGNQIPDGENKIEIRKKGRGPLYFNAYMSNFTMEDHITRAGLEVKIDRKVYKLTRVDAKEVVQNAKGQAIDQKIEKYERTELKNMDGLKSGELVEVELELESKNDYEYLVAEDMKAAGFEAVDVRSGYTKNAMNAYVEFRDERVCFFIRNLARGKHSVSYRLRAEIPGQFSALPAKISAMYAPELKGNSEEIKLKIAD